MFKGRTVIEIMILSFTGIVLIVMLMLAGFIFIVEIKSEGAADTNRSVDGLMSLVSGILGALLGLIAGKSSNGTPPSPTPPPTEGQP